MLFFLCSFDLVNFKFEVRVLLLIMIETCVNNQLGSSKIKILFNVSRLLSVCGSISGVCQESFIGQYSAKTELDCLRCDKSIMTRYLKVIYI